MNNYLHNNKNLKALIVTLVILIVISVFSFSESSVISNAINTVTSGLFKVSASATASADTVDKETLLKENKKLKQENAQLREQLVDYFDVKTENSKLWNYYELKKKNPSYSIIPSNVIMRDTNDDFYSFTLDIGKNSNVKINDSVITENGLVGWVSNVYLNTCKVKTILSPDTKAGAIDKKTNDSGIITGSASLCDSNKTQLTKISASNKIKKNDIVVTSGTGGVYPKDLIIGKVTEIKFNSYDTSIYALVEPYEDIKNITSAAVITEFSGKGEVSSKNEHK